MDELQPTNRHVLDILTTFLNTTTPNPWDSGFKTCLGTTSKGKACRNKIKSPIRCLMHENISKSEVHPVSDDQLAYTSEFIRAIHCHHHRSHPLEKFDKYFPKTFVKGALAGKSIHRCVKCPGTCS